MPAPAAVLWDMDGTLIDSEPYWIGAETELAAKFDVTWTQEDGLAMVGQAMDISARTLQERGVALTEPEILDYMIKRVAEQVRATVPWQADARALLDEVAAAGIPCALVTMSYTPLAQAFLEFAPDVFQVVVTGDNVEHGKPHPEPYLKAARELGVDITQCIVIEDSPTGVTSGHASGAHTIAVQRHVAVPALTGISRVTSLEGIDLQMLAEMLRGRAIDQVGDN